MKKESTKRPQTGKPAPHKLIAIGLDIDAGTPAKDTGKVIAVQIKKGQPMKNADSLGPDYSVDKRRAARREHTNHFTSRAPAKSK